MPTAGYSPLLPVTATCHGSLTLNTDGSFSYTPNVGFWGTDSFTYTATDGHATSAPATVTITVFSVPVAENDSYTDHPGADAGCRCRHRRTGQC